MILSADTGKTYVTAADIGTVAGVISTVYDEWNGAYLHELVEELAVEVVRLRTVRTREGRSEQFHLLNHKVLV